MPHLARSRSLPWLILLISLQCFAQLAAIGHGASHLAEHLAGRNAPRQVEGIRTSGEKPAPGSNNHAAAHACALCLLAHDLAQGLPSQSLLAGHVARGIDPALRPCVAVHRVHGLAPRQRGPPLLS